MTTSHLFSSRPGGPSLRRTRRGGIAVPAGAVRLAAAATLALLAGGRAWTAAADGPATRPAAAAATRPAADDPATAAAVDAQAAKLADPDWRVRERALGGLVQLGEAAVPAVERLAADTTVDEVRVAARTVLRQIAENKLIGTSYVTLHLKRATPRQAFDALSVQAGTPLKAFPDEMWESVGQQTVDLDVDRQPFWAAMQQLCRQTGIDLTVVDGRPRLTSGGVSRLGGRRNAVAGPFLIVPVGASLSRSVNYDADDPPVAEEFTLQLLAFPEPKLNVVRATQGVVLREAVDDQGNTLAPERAKAGQPGAAPGDDAEPSANPAGDGTYMLQVPLRRPKQPGGRLARLRGTVGFQLQVESQTVEVRDLPRLQNAVRWVGGTKVVFNELRADKEQGQYSLRLTAYPNPNADAGGRWEDLEQSLHQGLKLVDDRGQPLDANGADTTNAEDTKVELTLTFTPSHRQGDNNRAPRQSGDPVRLVWEIPTKTRDLVVPFELRDLKLP